MKKSVLLPILCLAISSQALADYDASNDLMQAFGGKCKGKGFINASAYSEANEIKNLITSIRDDGDCSGVSNALEQISSLNVDRLLSERKATEDYDSLAATANELELAIQKENSLGSKADSAYLDALKSELINKKVSMAKEKKLPNQQRLQTRLEALSNMQKYSTNLFAKLNQSDKCLTKHPNLGAQVSAQILGLSSNLGSGLVGSLMLTAGNLIDHFVSFMHNRSLNKDLKQIVTSRTGDAIGCAFEGVAATYCQSRDVETIIKANRDNQNDSSAKNSWQKGLDVTGREMQSFVEWVNHIDAGSAASTSGRAGDKKAELSKLAQLRNQKIEIESTLTSGQKKIDGSATSDAKLAALKTMALELAKVINPCLDAAPGFCGSSSNSAFTASFPDDFSCGPLIYLYSKGTSRVRDDNGQGPCTAYVAKKYPTPPSSDEMAKWIGNLTNEAGEAVNLSVSQVNESNPDLVLAQVDAKLGNRQSARDFMVGAEAYLNTLMTDPTSIAKKPLQKNLIEKTLKQIRTVIGTLDTKNSATNPSDKKVAKISNEIIPNGDTLAIPKALSEIVNQDIDQRIAEGAIDANLASLMSLSASNSLGELIKYYIGLDAAWSQARSAKGLSKDNLSVLARTFDNQLKTRLESLQKSAAQDPDDRPSLAMLCMQALAVPEAPSIGSLDLNAYCKGTSYRGIQNNSSLEMKFDDLIKADYPTRACSVYDFYRKSYLMDLKGRNNQQSKGTK